MRKPLSSLVAATGAAFILTAGVAAPALAVPANHMGTSPSVTVDRSQIYTADMTYTLPRGNDVRHAAPWSCGLFRVDGWGADTGGWRVAVGASYDMPNGFSFSLPMNGTDWRVTPWSGEFEGWGNPDSNATRLNTDAEWEHFETTYPEYTYMTGQEERVSVTQANGYVNVVVESMAKNEYFNIEFATTAIAPEEGDAAPTTRTVAASVLATCETPGAPVTDPSVPVRPAPDRDHGQAPIKKVNSGGVEDGAAGMVALGLGAAAVGGLALYGRRRASK